VPIDQHRDAVRRSLVLGAVCALTLTTLAACSSAGPTAPRASATTATSGTVPPPTLSAGQAATVTYCDHQQARITEPAELHGPAPAAVYVHGGAWISGNLDTGGFIIDTVGPALAARGFVVVSLDYRLGPSQQWPAQIEDVKCAIRYLRANAAALNINPDAIGAWGHSAGGHLVDLLGTAGPSAGWDVGPYLGESSKVGAIVTLAGPTDFLSMSQAGNSGIVYKDFVSIMGNVPVAKLSGQLAAASPVTYVAPGDPPFLLLQSTNDNVVFPQQSQELTWDLAANHVPYQLVMVDGGGHLFDQAGASPDPTAITRAIVDFFIQTLVFHRPIGPGT
jgi:acetyl esterase/lipase